jgi:hypothetical protein
MTSHALEGLPHLESLDIERLEREADEYERKASAIRQIIEAVRALNGEAESILFRRSFESHRVLFETRPLVVNGPRGRDAVLIVMREDPKRVWKVVDLKREILRRGWAPTPKAVEATIKRLRQDGELESAGYGHYKLRSESLSPAEPDSEAAMPPNLHRKEDAA